MKFEVIWSDFASECLDDIFKYYSSHASEKVAYKLIRSIINEARILDSNPFVGQPEPLLADRPKIYRYLIYKNYKIIYSVSEYEKIVKVHDVFDARQNPEKLADRNS